MTNREIELSAHFMRGWYAQAAEQAAPWSPVALRYVMATAQWVVVCDMFHRTRRP